MADEAPDSIVRDSWGFAVGNVELFSQYSPIWEQEESARIQNWAEYLSQTSDRATFGTNVKPESLSLESLVSEGLLDDAVAIARSGASHEESKKLDELVAGGVPFEIRGKAWKTFLDISVRKEEGYYTLLVDKALGDMRDLERALLPDEISVQTALTAAAMEGEAGGLGDKRTASGNIDVEAVSAAMGAAAERRYEDRMAQKEGSSAGGGGQGERSSSGDPPSEGGPQQAAHAWANSGRVWLVQIEKDLPRTFPGHPLMQQSGRSALRRVLAAYAFHNPEVGYCQGLNFVAGCLLMFMDEEDSFYCLSTVVEDILAGYYALDMLSTQVDQRVFKHLVMEEFPLVNRHLEAVGADISCVFAQWFLCLFVNFLPLETCLRVWDKLFYKRSCAVLFQWPLCLFVNFLPLETCLRVWDMLFYTHSCAVLFQVSFSLLETYSSALLAAEDILDALKVIQNMAPLTFDSRRLISVAGASFKHIDDTLLDKWRIPYKKDVLDDMAVIAKRRIAIKKSSPAVAKTTDSGPKGVSAVMKLLQRLERPSTSNSSATNLSALSSTGGILVYSRQLQQLPQWASPRLGYDFSALYLTSSHIPQPQLRNPYLSVPLTGTAGSFSSSLSGLHPSLDMASQPNGGREENGFWGGVMSRFTTSNTPNGGVARSEVSASGDASLIGTLETGAPTELKVGIDVV
eukprot:gene24566-10177_t